MNKRIERLVALVLLLVCAAIVWSQFDAHVRAQTSIPGPGSATISVTMANGALETTQTAINSKLGTFNVNVGATNETAASTDTATSGLNGRLQRIAQRLTSLIALLPTSLAANGGLKVEGVAGGVAQPVSAAASQVADLQCIAPATNTKAAYSAVTGSSTAVDAGCTANALWLRATNLSRTYDVKFTTPDGGSGRIPPSGTEFICKSGSATPDNLTFDATCDTCNTGRVSITAGCAS